MRGQPKEFPEVRRATNLDRGRPAEQERPDHADELGHGGVVLEIGLAVSRRDPGDLGGRLGRLVPQQDGAPVGEREEVGGVERQDAVAEAVQLEVPDDPRLQQADHVRGGGDAKPGPRLLRDRRAAQDAPSFEVKVNAL